MMALCQGWMLIQKLYYNQRSIHYYPCILIKGSCSGSFARHWERWVVGRREGDRNATIYQPKQGLKWIPTSFLEMHFSLFAHICLLLWHYKLQQDFWALAAIQAADGLKCSLKSVCGWWNTPYTWPLLHTRHQHTSWTLPVRRRRKSFVRHLSIWKSLLKAFGKARWPKLGGNAVNWETSTWLVRLGRGERESRRVVSFVVYFFNGTWLLLFLKVGSSCKFAHGGVHFM